MVDQRQTIVDFSLIVEHLPIIISFFALISTLVFSYLNFKLLSTNKRKTQRDNLYNEQYIYLKEILQIFTTILYRFYILKKHRRKLLNGVDKEIEDLKNDIENNYLIILNNVHFNKKEINTLIMNLNHEALVLLGKFKKDDDFDLFFLFNDELFKLSTAIAKHLGLQNLSDDNKNIINNHPFIF